MKTYKLMSCHEAPNYNAALIIENTFEIYSVQEWLTNCIEKKMKRGITPDLEQLAASSTVGKMLTLTDKELRACGCPKLTQEERKELRRWIANNVLCYAYAEFEA